MNLNGSRLVFGVRKSASLSCHTCSRLSLTSQILTATLVTLTSTACLLTGHRVLHVEARDKKRGICEGATAFGVCATLAHVKCASSCAGQRVRAKNVKVEEKSLPKLNDHVWSLGRYTRSRSCSSWARWPGSPTLASRKY